MEVGQSPSCVSCNGESAHPGKVDTLTRLTRGLKLESKDERNMGGGEYGRRGRRGIREEREKGNTGGEGEGEYGRRGRRGIWEEGEEGIWEEGKREGCQ